MAHAGQPPIPVFRVPQHHGKNLGGRPRNAWDSNRRALAVALYFWSTLSMEDKMKCLSGPNFEPGKSNLESELRKLLNRPLGVYPRRKKAQRRVLEALSSEMRNERGCLNRERRAGSVGSKHCPTTSSQSRKGPMHTKKRRLTSAISLGRTAKNRKTQNLQDIHDIPIQEPAAHSQYLPTDEFQRPPEPSKQPGPLCSLLADSISTTASSQLTALQLQQSKNPPIQESSTTPSPHALTSLRSPHSEDDMNLEHIVHTPAGALNAQEVPTLYDEEGKPTLDWDWNICPCCQQPFGGIQCTQNGCIDTSLFRDDNKNKNTALFATETNIFAELDSGILGHDRHPNQEPAIESKLPMPIIEALSTPISFLQQTIIENKEAHDSQLLRDDSHNPHLTTIIDSHSPSQRESRASDSCNPAPVLQYHELQQESPETSSQGSIAGQVAAFVPGERSSVCSLIPSIMSLGRRLNKQNRDSITSSLVRHTHAVMRGALRPAAFVGLDSSSRMSLIRSAAPSFFTEDTKTVQQKTTQQRWAELKGLDWPVCDATSLSTRPCCSLDLRNIEHRRCENCGFSVALEDARRCVKNANRESTKEVDIFGNGVLHHAAAAGRASFSFLEYLISCGADINAKNTSRETFMHTLHPQGLGGFANYLKLLRLLDQESFDLQCTDRYGQTLSHILLREFEISKISIDEIEEAFDLLKPDIGAADNLGRTIEDYLKHWISAVELHTGGIRTIFESNTKRKARLEMLRSKFKLSWDDKLWIHHPDEFLNSGNVTGNDVDSWLLSMQMSGCDKKIDPRSGSNAIVTMLRQRSDTPVPILVKAILKLLDNGLEIDHQDREGFTALAHASCLGIRPVVEALLERGANPNIRAYNSMSLLDQVNWTLDQALRKKLDSLYASIMSCTGPLLEGGALSDPTSFDTWRLRQPARLQNKMLEPKPQMKTSSHQPIKQISDPSPQHPIFYQNPIFQGDSVDSRQVMDDQLPLLEGFEEFQFDFNAYHWAGNENV